MEIVIKIQKKYPLIIEHNVVAIIIRNDLIPKINKGLTGGRISDKNGEKVGYFNVNKN